MNANYVCSTVSLHLCHICSLVQPHSSFPSEFYHILPSQTGRFTLTWISPDWLVALHPWDSMFRRHHSHQYPPGLLPNVHSPAWGPAFPLCLSDRCLIQLEKQVLLTMLAMNKWSTHIIVVVTNMWRWLLDRKWTIHLCNVPTWVILSQPKKI